MKFDIAGMMMHRCSDSDKEVHFFRPWDKSSVEGTGPMENEEDGRSVGGSNTRDSSESSDVALTSSASIDHSGSYHGTLVDPGQIEDLARVLGLPDWSGCVPPMPGLQQSIGYEYPVWPTSYMEYASWLSDYHEAVLRLNCQDAIAKQQKKNRPKKFKCQICNTAFSNNGQLKGHLRIHTGERPFRCQHFGCGKSFTRNEELTRHKRIHTGLRPYACAICSKGFGRKDHLKKHVRTHGRQTFRLAHQEFLALAPFIGSM